MMLLLATAISLMTGGAMVCLLWPGRLRSELLLKFSLATGLGLGTSSIIYFLLLSARVVSRISLLIAELTLLTILAAALLLMSKSFAGLKFDHTRFCKPHTGDDSGVLVFIKAAFGATTILSTYVFIANLYN